MEIIIQPTIFGRNKNGEYVYDWANSSKNVIGAFANTQTIAIVVIRLYFKNKRYDVLDEWITMGMWDLEESCIKLQEFSSKYKIQHYLGNSTAQCLYTGDTVRGLKSGQVIEGWESTQIDVEKMYVLFQGRLKITHFAEELKDKWQEELKSFDIFEALQNKKVYPRLFAFFHILAGVNVWYNPLFVEYPDILVDDSGEVIIQPSDEKKINDAYKYICHRNDYHDFYRKLPIDTQTLCGISGVSEHLVNAWMCKNKSVLEARGNF